MDNNFDNQVSLLLRILPEVIRVKNFALKGGTAINMFGICQGYQWILI